jgi:hypothetical protein
MERLPAYRPQTVGTDGWDATPSFWKSLLPADGLILCCLHSALNVAERCGRDLPLCKLVRDRVWEVYEARTRAQCSQRLRNRREWATTRLSEGAVREMVLKRCRQVPPFAPANRFLTAHRTSTPSMASSITPTGFTICSWPPPWEDEEDEPRNPIKSAMLD